MNNSGRLGDEMYLMHKTQKHSWLSALKGFNILCRTSEELGVFRELPDGGSARLDDSDVSG